MRHFWGYFEKILKNLLGYFYGNFWTKNGLVFVPTSGHTVTACDKKPVLSLGIGLLNLTGVDIRVGNYLVIPGICFLF